MCHLNMKQLDSRTVIYFIFIFKVTLIGSVTDLQNCVLLATFIHESYLIESLYKNDLFARSRKRKKYKTKHNLDNLFVT